MDIQVKKALEALAQKARKQDEEIVELREELAAAQEQGYISTGSMGDYPRVDTSTQLSRDQVAAEAKDWNNNNGNFVAY